MPPKTGKNNSFKLNLAHLGQRLKGELMGYAGTLDPFLVVVCHHPVSTISKIFSKTYTFEWEKTIKIPLEGKNLQKMGT